MLYQALEKGETVELIIGGHFGKELQQAKVGKPTHRGIVAATNKRVLFLDKGIITTEAAEISYKNIEAITHSTGMFAGGLRITGIGGISFRVESVRPKDSVRTFADKVRSQMAIASAQPEQSPQKVSPSDEIEKLGSLLDRGFLTQDEFDNKKKQLLDS